MRTVFTLARGKKQVHATASPTENKLRKAESLSSKLQVNTVGKPGVLFTLAIALHGNA
jgi:hypothetical protein